MSPLRISEKSFNAQHRRLNRRLQAFSLTKSGRNIVTAQTKKNLMLASASSLKAINCNARIRFAGHLVDQLRAIINHPAASKILFVTLIMEEHAVPYRSAAEFNVKACKNAAGEFLKGLDYFGMIEAAFYYYAPFISERRQPFVSWHSHAIVWNTTRDELAVRQRRLNRTHRAFVSGWRAAHYHMISPEHVPSYARYMSKSILKEYTAYPKMREVVDLETGEFIKRPTGKWINRKRDIRPTNLARAMTAIGNRTLKQLSFGGGAGRALRSDLLKATRTFLRRDAATRAARRKKLLFGS